MVVVVIGATVGAAAWKPAPLGFMVGFDVTTYGTFIFFGRRAFPPHRRKLVWWAAAAIGVAVIAALSGVLAFLFIAAAEAALVWLAVSREDWLPFDAAQLIPGDACPKCGERRLHAARVCRRCGCAFDATA